MWDSAVLDLRYALRRLLRTPVFTMAAAVTLALGIGADSAVFNVLNSVMLRSLPVRQPERLLQFNTQRNYPRGVVRTGLGGTSFSDYAFEQLRSNASIFSDVIAFAPVGNGKISVRSGGSAGVARVEMVSGNFFAGLGIQPLLGHLFKIQDEKQQSNSAVISYGYWSDRMGGNGAALGQTIYINGFPFTIVGIAPRDFFGLDPGTATDIWVPLQDRPQLTPWGYRPNEASLFTMANWWCLMVWGRLAPGATEDQANSVVNSIFSQAALAGIGSPEAHDQAAPRVFFSSASRGLDTLRARYSKSLWISFGLVGMVLLIACGNIAVLLLVRGAARQHELSLQLALGARFSYLLRQLMTEYMLIAVAGGMLGILFEILATQALVAWMGMPASAISIEGRVLAFTAAVSLGTGVLFSVFPAIGSLRFSKESGMRGSSAAVIGKHRNYTGSAVIALQIALCLAILVSAGLFLRSLRKLEQVDMGFQTQNLLLFAVDPTELNLDPDQVTVYYQSLLQKLRMIPGVSSATVTQNRIGGGWNSNSYVLVDGTEPGHGEELMRWNAVGPDFVHTFGMKLVLGRDFSDADAAGSPKVVIINQTFAQRFFADLPLGHMVGFARSKRLGALGGFSIVGVVKDSKYTGVRDKAAPTAYFPYSQMPGAGQMHFALRTQGGSASVLPAVRQTVAASGQLPLLDLTTQQEQMEETFAEERSFARLSGIFALLAAVLVGFGLYATISYLVARRRAEIGIRMALGAGRISIFYMVLRQGLMLTAAGMAMGLPLAYLSGRMLRNLLYGVGTIDLVAVILATLGMTVMAILAVLRPAAQAAFSNPLESLRSD